METMAEGKIYSGYPRTQPKRLHVRVAEAIGWTHPKHYMGDCCIAADFEEHWPHFDTSWAETGPLIRRFGISLAPDQSYPGMWGAWVGDFAPLRARNLDPLVAVCELILAMKEAGRI